MKRNGILVGGNWIIDQVKETDTYPQEEQLANILAEFQSNGGAAYNLLKDLSKLQVPFPLAGIGLVGEDERGRKILDECRQLGIDTGQLRQTKLAATSYTDVMSVRATGKRTFFHQRGANALLEESHFDLAASRARIFHLGYLLLLDKLDEIKPDGSTGAAQLLKYACQEGFTTSVDLVSEASARFRKIVPLALPFTDILFVNELEASMLTGISTVAPNGEAEAGKCCRAAAAMLAMGVRQWVIVHFPQGVVALSRQGQRLFQPSIHLPGMAIVGAVGAGDAFAAGVLTGVHEAWPMEKCLELGVCVAASCLSAATCSDGVLPAQACLALAGQYGYRLADLAVE
ncbi:MAG: carbohydrate kinase family protein [Adhaeribacter sp.]